MAKKLVKVSLVKSPDSYTGVTSALKLLEKDILASLKNKKKILVKPNFISIKHELSATPVEAVQAVLEFLKPHIKYLITIAEGCATESAFSGFKKFGYLNLVKKYNVSFVDLNQDKVGREVTATDASGAPFKVGIAKTVTDSDFIISVTRPKTHDTGVVTLSLKNLLMGAVLEKAKMHQGMKFHWNLLALARVFKPHLSVIDGTVSMDGEGPVFGDAKKTNFAVAGLDFLAVDSLVANLMGFNLKDIGYLWLCKEAGLGVGDWERIEVVGEKPENFQFQFRPHPSFKRQIQWQTQKVVAPTLMSRLTFGLFGLAKKLIPDKLLLSLQEIKPLRQLVVRINNRF